MLQSFLLRVLPSDSPLNYQVSTLINYAEEGEGDRGKGERNRLVLTILRHDTEEGHNCSDMENANKRSPC